MALYNSFIFVAISALLILTVAVVQGAPSSNGGLHHRQARQAPADCYNQNEELLPQAKAHTKDALDKLSTVNELLDNYYGEMLMNCIETYAGNDLITGAHQIIVNTYNTEPVSFKNLLPSYDYNHNCSHIQTEVNNSISFIECSTTYIGIMLQNLTRSVIQPGVFTNATTAVRQAMYNAYRNVSWIPDIKNLISVLPCAIEQPSVNAQVCNTEYSTISVQLRTNPLANTCAKDLLTSENNSEYLKQVVVLAEIAEYYRRLDKILNTYTSHCLS